jgi:plastocyanin
MGIRRYALALLCALLGAAIPVFPAVAGSETGPTIAAENAGLYYHYWRPPSVTIAPAATVTISNPTTVPHGVEWRPGAPATPTCSAGVPVGTSEAASGTSWTGTCTFTTPGTYTFWCTVHHAAMSATVTVNSGGSTTTTTTTPTTTTTTTGPTPATPPTTTTTGTGVLPSAEGAPPLLHLAHGQRGHTVHGAIDVTGAEIGARLEVDLLAGRASLARAGSRVRVGRVLRSSLPAGRVSFSVPLNARARAALRRHRHLALTVRILLTPSHSPAVSISRAVVLHP